MAPPSEGSTPVHTMKRTGRSSWTAFARSGPATMTPLAAATQTQKNNPNESHLEVALPARVVNDLIDSVSSPAAASPLVRQKLSQSSKITALQREWEKEKQQMEKAHNDSSNNGDDSASSRLSLPSDKGARGDVQEPSAAVKPSDSTSNSSEAVKHQQTNATSKQAETSPVPLPAYVSQQAKQLSTNRSSSEPRSRATLEDQGAGEKARAKAEAKKLKKQRKAEAKAKREAEHKAQRYSEEAVLKQLQRAMPTPKTKAGESRVKPAPSHPSSSHNARSRPSLTPSMLVEITRRQLVANITSDSDHTVTDTSDESDLKDTSSLTASHYGNPAVQGIHPMLDKNIKGISYYLTESDGIRVSTSGAPIAPGHERHDGPGRPFICPVRDCRALSHNIKSMSSHFHGRHSGARLNDNGDGTFSKIGVYSNKDSTSPGIVVSQNPLSPGAPPALTPVYTQALKQKLGIDEKNAPFPPLTRPTEHPKRSLEIDNRLIRDIPSKRPRVTPVPPPSIVPVRPLHTAQGDRMPTTESLRYLHKFLSPEQRVPDREDIRALAAFKRVRELPDAWVMNYETKILEAQTYACALAYLVGEEVKGPRVCRAPGKIPRLSQPCIALPSGLSDEAKTLFSKKPSCVACRYYSVCYRQANRCEWNQENKPSIDNSDKEESKTEDDSKMEGQDHGSSSRLGSESEPEQKESEPEPDSEKEDGPIVQPALARKKSRLVTTNTLRLVQPTNGSVSSPSVLSVAPAMNQFSINNFEMEDWEFAPGTFKDETTSENIGFSGAYLSGHPVTVSPDIEFNVLALNPGATHTWPAVKNKIRTCSVASGKIRVKIGGQEPKRMGTHSAWVIKPGQTCTIENRLYISAAIHCHTVADYELLPDGER